MAYDGADDWMVEGVAQFLRCPLWTGPVHNFIDDNCAMFGDCQDQAQGGQRSTGHTVEHKRLHDEFRELVDSKLTTYIDELGVDAARLLEVCQQTTHPAGKQLLEYVTALDRFETFVQILTKRNHELELEALEQLRRLQAASQGDAPTPLRPDAPSTEDVEAETDAERLAREEEEMIAKAIAASLQTTEVTQKQAEVEDDELQKALQVSLAFEESRLAAAKAEAEAEAQRKADEAAAAVKEAARVEAEKQAAAAAQAKADDAAKAVAAAEAKAAAEEMAAAEAAAAKAKAEAEAVAAAKAKELEEESRARQEKLNEETLAARRENAAKAHEAPAPTPAPTPAEAPPKAPLAAESGKPALAPLAVRSLPPLGGNSGASFGTRTKLPDIAPSSAPSQPTQLAPQPAFAELVSQASPASPQPTSGPTEEELKQRAAYMKAQRDKILAQKKKERATEMADYVAKQPDAPAGAAKPTTDEAHQKLSVELARRFRADIVRNASS